MKKHVVLTYENAQMHFKLCCELEEIIYDGLSPKTKHDF